MREDIERKIRELSGRSIAGMAELLGYSVCSYPFRDRIEEVMLGPPHRIIILAEEIYNDPHRRARAVAHALGHEIAGHRWGQRVLRGEMTKRMLREEAEADAIAQRLLEGRAREIA